MQSTPITLQNTENISSLKNINDAIIALTAASIEESETYFVIGTTIIKVAIATSAVG